MSSVVELKELHNVNKSDQKTNIRAFVCLYLISLPSHQQSPEDLATGSFVAYHVSIYASTSPGYANNLIASLKLGGQRLRVRSVCV